MESDKHDNQEEKDTEEKDQEESAKLSDPEQKDPEEEENQEEQEEHEEQQKQKEKVKKKILSLCHGKSTTSKKLLMKTLLDELDLPKDKMNAVVGPIKDKKKTFKYQALAVSEKNHPSSTHRDVQKCIQPQILDMDFSDEEKQEWIDEHSGWKELVDSCMENDGYCFKEMDTTSEDILLFRTSCIIYSWYQHDLVVKGSLAPLDSKNKGPIDIQQSVLMSRGYGKLFKWVYSVGKREEELKSPFVEDIPDWDNQDSSCKLTLFLALTQSTAMGKPTLKKTDGGKIKFVKYMSIVLDDNLEKEPLCYNLRAERKFKQGTILPLYVIGSCLVRAKVPFHEWSQDLDVFPGDSIYSVAVMDRKGHQCLHDPMLKILTKRDSRNSPSEWKLFLGLGMHFAHCAPEDEEGNVIGMDCGHYLVCHDIKKGEMVYYNQDMSCSDVKNAVEKKRNKKRGLKKKHKSLEDIVLTPRVQVDESKYEDGTEDGGEENEEEEEVGQEHIYSDMEDNNDGKPTAEEENDEDNEDEKPTAEVEKEEMNKKVDEESDNDSSDKSDDMAKNNSKKRNKDQNDDDSGETGSSNKKQKLVDV